MLLKVMIEHLEMLKKINKESLKLSDYFLEYNHKMIIYFQHERAVHLIVTLFFALLTFLSFLFTLSQKSDNIFLLCTLDFLLLALTIAYIIYYFRLENTLQQMYKITQQIYNSFQSDKK